MEWQLEVFRETSRTEEWYLQKVGYVLQDKSSDSCTIRFNSIDDDWSFASWWMSMKSIVAACIRDKASATTFCLPRM